MTVYQRLSPSPTRPTSPSSSAAGTCSTYHGRLRARRRLRTRRSSRDHAASRSAAAANSASATAGIRQRSRTSRCTARASSVVAKAADEARRRSTHAAIRFTPYRDDREGVLPVTVRNIEQRRPSAISVGCRYMPNEALAPPAGRRPDLRQLRPVDEFQLSRRGNPGLLRGTSGSSACRSTRPIAASSISCAACAAAGVPPPTRAWRTAPMIGRLAIVALMLAGWPARHWRSRCPST